MLPEKEQKYKGLIVAKYYVFYKYILSNPENKVEFEHLGCKNFYNQYKKIFDDTYDICISKNIDISNFMYFLLHINGISKITNINDQKVFDNYDKYRAIEKQKKLIYDTFNKSALYIAKECIKYKLTCKEYLKRLVLNNQLAIEYMCGNISKYYICTIQNFDKIYLKLNKVNRDELSILYNSYEIINQTVQDTFLGFKNTVVKPIQYTDNIIYKLKTKLKTKTN